MPRARNIKPQIMANEDLAELDAIGRLLFVYLWMLADREGRLEDRPKRIKAQALPYDDADVDALLSDLQKAGFIVRYTVGEQAIIQIVAFTKHQNPHSREQDSELPGIGQNGTKHNLGSGKAQPRQCRAGLIPDSLNLIPDSPISDSGSPSAQGGQAKSRFSEWWEHYPRKKAKDAAEKSWKRNGCDAIADKIIADTLRRSEMEWTDIQFTPYPATYLNGKRWNDQIEDNRNAKGNQPSGNNSRAKQFADAVHRYADDAEEVDRGAVSETSVDLRPPLDGQFSRH